VERFPLVRSLLLDGDTFAELPEDDEVVDEGRGKERVLAGVVHHYCIFAPHENFGGVFVHRTFGVSHVGDIFDDDSMVWMFVLLE